MRELDVRRRHPAGVMDEVPRLFVVPPAKGFDLEADGLQRRLGTLQLHLLPAMRQGKRQAAIKEDFHGPQRMTRDCGCSQSMNWNTLNIVKRMR
jgi:hypothetical protein